MRPQRTTLLACLVCCLGLGLSSCGDDDARATEVNDAGPRETRQDGAAGADKNVTSDLAPGANPLADVGGDATAPAGDDGVPDARPLSPSALRGKYLAESVLDCGGCHDSRETPPRPLAGVPCFRDSLPTVDQMGCLNSSNLTNHETGLKSRSDAQIKELIRSGRRPDGLYLFSAMPTHLLANLSDDDTQALVDYLRTVPGVDNRLPANQDPWGNDCRGHAPVLLPYRLDQPNTIPVAAPGAPAGASNGRYLAALACIECHSKASNDATRAFDIGLAFQGGRAFMPPAGVVYSSNLTPDTTGTQGWTAGDFVKVLQLGLDRDGKKVCAPMPSHPGLTGADAADIGSYLLALPAKANPIPLQCSM